MPLEKTCSISAFRRNLRTEIKAGKTPEQAAAIARKTLEEACSDEGKLVPRAVQKKERSREYLEAALEHARKLLPGWMYAVIHRAALPSSGGRAARNRRLSAMEKAWLERGCAALSNTELETVWAHLVKESEARERKGMSGRSVHQRAQQVLTEMHGRGLDVVLEKGFVTGKPEGGMHAHGLDRRNAKTADDGAHLHLFVVPGTGDHLLTWEDGTHVHEIKNDWAHTDKSGKHSHRVAMPDGFVLETRLGGSHTHALMVETSGFGGEHTHTLVLPDGTVIESLNVGQYVERFVDTGSLHSLSLAPASRIVNALNELQWLQAEADNQRDLPLSEVVELFAKTGERPPPVPTTWEVVEITEEGVVCALNDMDGTVCMKSADDVDLCVGDLVVADSAGCVRGFVDATEPDTWDLAESAGIYAEELQKATADVGFVGSKDARLLFIAGAPSAMEVARGEALIGPDGELFRERYLGPLGLTKEDVAVGFAIPVQCEAPTSEQVELWRDRLLQDIALHTRCRVVALGLVAKEALGPLAVCTLPHPAALRRHKDTGEVARKLKKLRKALDIKVKNGKYTPSPDGANPMQGPPGATPSDATRRQRKEHIFRVGVSKADDKKQIIYGVVLSPYEVDLQDDWSPPAEIESTAHDFLVKSRIIGLRHSERADAALVESHVEQYPTSEDHTRAMQNLPHTATRRQFGSDVIHSGDWAVGVRLSDELWADHLKGELDAFSIGGHSLRIPVSPDVMPEVTFVDLVPSA